MRFIIALSLLALTVADHKARFDFYRVHRVQPKNEAQILALRDLEFTNEYNFWSEISTFDSPVDIMVPPHKRDEFGDFIMDNKLEEKIIIENVQRLIDEESTTGLRAKGMEWSNYHNLEDIYNWLDELQKKHPKIVKVVVGGKTYEGRQIKGIEINFGTNYTGVFIESGIHAREWIAPAGTTWMINQILNNGSVDPVFKRFNYLYFPVYNPDGYQYSWTTNRMWRKTRTPYKSGARSCYGADPNRNWDCHWNEIGSSKDPCSETYAGPRVFSEVETKSMSEYLSKVSRGRKQDIFIAYHSYGQMILYPWGWTKKPAPHDKIFSKVGKAAAKDLASVHGTQFRVGSVSTIIYPTSGTSLEWYYQTFNGTLDFIYEMRDTGVHGFVLPPKYIIPSAQEHFASLRRILLEYETLKK